MSFDEVWATPLGARRPILHRPWHPYTCQRVPEVGLPSWHSDHIHFLERDLRYPR